MEDVYVKLCELLYAEQAQVRVEQEAAWLYLLAGLPTAGDADRPNRQNELLKVFWPR